MSNRIRSRASSTSNVSFFTDAPPGFVIIGDSPKNHDMRSRIREKEVEERWQQWERWWFNCRLKGAVDRVLVVIVELSEGLVLGLQTCRRQEWVDRKGL